MSEYLSVTQFAHTYGMDTSRVRLLIRQGRIPEAVRIGNQWAIPSDTPKPTDNRIKTGKYINWRKQKPDKIR